MSDYPSTPLYGANYGQNQPNPPYVPPAYPNQYSQPDDGHMGQHQYAPSYDSNMAAYGYNGAVPGFSAAALAAGAPPLPIYQGWNQDPVPLPPYNAQSNMQHTGYTTNAYNNYPQQYPPPPQNYQQNIQPAKPYDEGEVSEGEFEGAYTPQNSTHVNYGANQYSGNGGNVGNGYVDTAHRAVYAPPPIQAAPGNEYNYSREAPQLKRQQSGSYSPYAALPRDDRRDERPATFQQNKAAGSSQGPERYINGSGQTQNNSSWYQNRNTNISRPSSRAHGSHVTKVHETTDGKNLPATKVPSARSSPTHAPTLQPTFMTASNPPPRVHTVPPPEAPRVVYDKAELRKKAEGAILNLLPHDIRFEKYIEEGIAEDVIGPLFDDIRVPRTSSKHANDASLPPSAIEAQRATATAFSTSNQTGKENEPFSVFNGSSAAQAQKVDQSIKKSLTAPLTEKPHNLSSNGVSISPPTTTINPATAAAAIEKEQTLKKKMEALRKSREERAQKAAAKNNPKSLTVPAPAPVVSESEKPKPNPAMSSSNSPSTTPLPPANSQQPQNRSAFPQPQPPTQNVATQQTPAIPGLFLASAAASPVPSTTNSTIYNNQFNQRKRPVAADFVTPAPVTPFKRPFGHSRSDTPLVIDVSEDEGDSDDGDIAMDLDSQADQDSPVQSARKLSDQRNTAINNLPMLTNFPARKLFTPPVASSAATTPPVSRKSTLGRPEDLQAKEMQIEELRRKIAEAEAAKAQKKAQQSASGTHTPQPVNYSSENAVLTNESMANKVETSIQIQNMIDIADEKVNHDQKRLLEAQAVEEEKVTELKKQEAESKRLRREKIATDLPRIDAEVLEKQQRLEKLKVQMAEMEAEVQKNLREKQRMAEEMERLGQEAEDQLQAQKEKLRGLTQAENESKALTPGPTTSTPVAVKDIAPAIQPPTDQSQTLVLISNDNVGSAEKPEACQTEHKPPIPIRDSSAIAHSNDSQIEVLASTVPPEVQLDRSNENGTTNQDLEEALQEAVRAEADSQEGREEGELKDGMDIDDSYAPDPNQLAPESPIQKEYVNRSPSYAPALERGTSNASDPQSDADYEPPDADPLVDPTPTQSPPFSPAPAEPITEESNDLVIFPSISGPSATDDVETVDSSLPQTNGSVPILTEDVSTDQSDQTRYFTPYKSPLKQFRAFRFHPSFNQDVSGGFRSLTYSHNINPNLEMCPWEMAGGACNDKTCQYQHVKNITLPDDAVLSALGSPDEFTGEQRKQFCDGLKEVLTDLRARKIRDFDIIAKEVVAHRAKFLGGNKVLMLEGTEI